MIWRLTGLFFLFCLLNTNVYANKPVSPLSVVIESTTPAVAGERFELIVTISSRIALKDVDIKLDIPSEVSLVSGQGMSHIDVEAGKYQELHYVLQLPDMLAGRIRVSAVVEQGKAVRYAAHDSIALAPGVRRARSRDAKIPHEIKEHNGRRLREYVLPK